MFITLAHFERHPRFTAPVKLSALTSCSVNEASGFTLSHTGAGPTVMSRDGLL